jgi:hypothetical protein
MAEIDIPSPNGNKYHAIACVGALARILNELAPLIGRTDRSAGGSVDLHERNPAHNVTPPSPLPHSHPFPGPQQRDDDNKSEVGNRNPSENDIDRSTVDFARWEREQTPTSFGGQLPAFLTLPPEEARKTNAQQYYGSRTFDGDDYHEPPASHSGGGVITILAMLGLILFGGASALHYLFYGSTSLPFATISKASNSLIEIERSYGSPKRNNAKAARKDVVAMPSIPPGGRPVALSEPVASPPITDIPPLAETASAVASSEPKKIHTIAVSSDQSNSLGAIRDSLLLDDGGTPNSASPPEPSPFATPPVRPATPHSIEPAAERTGIPSSLPRAHTPTGPRSGESRLVASVSPVRSMVVQKLATSCRSVNNRQDLNPKDGILESIFDIWHTISEKFSSPHRSKSFCNPIRPTLNAGNVARATAAGYAVQLTAQRSTASARAAFRALQTKFPSQLKGREPIVRRVDLGTKGVYYRALVGPFTSAETATGACTTLKAAGGNCIVQRI